MWRSLLLMATSALAYLAFLAAAVKGFHAENPILTLRYSPNIPLEGLHPHRGRPGARSSTHH